MPENTPTRTVPPLPLATPAPSTWALAGVAAALGSFASVFLSMMLSVEYVAGRVLTPEDLDASLLEKLPVKIAFHVVTLVTALLLLLFAAGLHRRLRAISSQESLAPILAFAGLVLVVVAQMLGTGLDTEFLLGIEDRAYNLPGDIGFYAHWVATIPWLWFGGGVAALAVGAAGRAGAVPRWLGAVSTVLGVITVLVAISPLQYLAVGPGALWVLIAAIGFIAEARRRAA